MRVPPWLYCIVTRRGELRCAPGFDVRERSRLAVALLAFKECHDRHRVAMPERKVCLEPGHHGTRFHSGLELTAFGKTFVCREPTKVRGPLAGFRSDVVEVGLKSHGGILR